jgi:hypothetical protein
MTTDEFAAACLSLRDFPARGEPGPNQNNNGRKVVGMIGGEPLLHPNFVDLCGIMRAVIPDKINRGLWTGWKDGVEHHQGIIGKTFGPASNYNYHQPPSVHQPVLVAIEELFPDDPETMWGLINGCWVQRIWSSAITPRGFYFCEVAATLSMVMDGPDGLPVIPGCWEHDLEAYQYQIEWACPKCGCSAPLPGREDVDGMDDISPGNVARLQNSPAVKAGKYHLFDVAAYDPAQHDKNWQPNLYRSEQRR